MGKFKFLKRSEISKLPKNSGVYCFKNKKGRNLYIGKASNLKERVKSHFQQLGFKESLFLNEVDKIGYLKTDSEIEALILEANLIKKYQPKYNIVWRDDKNYFYVVRTREDFPRFFLTHQLKGEADYVGPFVDGKNLKQTLKVLRKVFPYRSCKTLPKKPCLWYQLERCPAPCLIKSKLGKEIPGAEIKMKKECQRNAENIFRILQGKKIQVLKNLKKEMKKTSQVQDFERAAKIRDQIRALEKVISHAKIFEIPLPLPAKNWPQIEENLQKILKTKKVISRIEAYDISNIQGEMATGAMVTFIAGLPDKNSYRKFKIKITGRPNDLAMIKEVLLRRFRHQEWPYPDLILIDGGKPQLNVAVNSKLQIPDWRKIKVVALAKKKNELFIENQEKPIFLKSLPREIFNLILQLRDEAHRFAISYHKKLRKKSLIDK